MARGTRDKGNRSTQLIADFVSIASQRGIAAEEGNAQLANRLLVQLGKVKKRVDSAGEPGRAAVLSILNDPNPWVRLEAANHALTFAETEAKTVLENLRVERTSAGPMAQALLDLWLKKRWDSSSCAALDVEPSATPLRRRTRPVAMWIKSRRK